MRRLASERGVCRAQDPLQFDFPAAAGYGKALPGPRQFSDITSFQHTVATSDAAAAQGYAMNPAANDKQWASTSMMDAQEAGHGGPPFQQPQSWQVGKLESCDSCLGAEVWKLLQE